MKDKLGKAAIAEEEIAGVIFTFIQDVNIIIKVHYLDNKFPSCFEVGCKDVFVEKRAVKEFIDGISWNLTEESEKAAMVIV